MPLVGTEPKTAGFEQPKTSYVMRIRFKLFEIECPFFYSQRLYLRPKNTPL
jgi:hypothetical protein